MAQEITLFVPNEEIILTREGVWLSNGQEITHGETLRAFARGLRRDEDGYFIQVGKDTKRIKVEDTPYFVVRVEGSAQEGYEIVLNDETRERLQPVTLKYSPGRLVCQVKNHLFEAKFIRAPYHELLSQIRQEGSYYTLQIEGKTIVFK